MAQTARQRRSKIKSVKIVVTGPYAVGKTTLIKSISEIPVLATERKITDGTESSLKNNTTVAMDFGRLTIADDLALYLFGTPGQKRFDFMWEIVAEGMLGFIVLVDATRAESCAEAADTLAFFQEQADVPFVVGVNKWDDPDAALSEAQERLSLPSGTRMLAVNAMERESVKECLLALLYNVMKTT